VPNCQTSLVVEQEMGDIMRRCRVWDPRCISVDQTYLRVRYDAMLDRPRCDERSMNVFPVLVELLLCEIRAALNEANDADIASCRHSK
jgi:hypothetical protein